MQSTHQVIELCIQTNADRSGKWLYGCVYLWGMLSRKAKYALKALAVLARHSEPAPLRISQIAAEAHIPEKFLSLILLDLKRGGFVASRLGKVGGYVMAQAPEKIFIGSVLRVVDGPLALAPCASQSAHQRCVECPDYEVCVVRFLLTEVRDTTAAILDNCSLRTFTDQAESFAALVDGEIVEPEIPMGYTPEAE
jgi:Rrf2 family protein